MNSKDIISIYEDVIIQIATPYSTGTGYYLKSHNLIITNEHVVRGNKSVVVDGKCFGKSVVNVVYRDKKYDLAFVEVPDDHNMPDVPWQLGHEVNKGDKIFAIGYPYDLKYTVTQGIVSGMHHHETNISYIQHDAALNPGNSGGPLINDQGTIIGINTFILKDGTNIGFALPIDIVADALSHFKKGHGSKGCRCNACNQIIFENNNITYRNCPTCGTAHEMISDTDDYEPYGICKAVEHMISRLGYTVPLTRKGPNNWTLKKGSASINISYYEKTGLLVGDVYLCTLPASNIEALYTYILQQNYVVDGCTFSVRDQDIILSLLIYDQYLHADTMYRLFHTFIKMADRYDNILTDVYGSKCKSATQ